MEDGFRTPRPGGLSNHDQVEVVVLHVVEVQPW